LAARWQYAEAEKAGWSDDDIAVEPESGYKSVEWMHEIAARAGLCPSGRHEMPANNLALHWQRHDERE